ncbi:kinesin-like protein KIF14 isoform X2 [Sphaerodactylus townsendi]|uniref:kinesin-like protein KIF14 isoform X2 n=1 Tax=Sphaerodactylus townsendi TaxID=933632 RepID=UPI002025DB25|nr:kinesin-like protein KIF14 isoform X2 [Sphaerodactylus townsendi]
MEMPIYPVPKRCHTDTLGVSSKKYAPENIIAKSNGFGPQVTSQATGKERDTPLSQSWSKTEEINRTYVISACKKLGEASVACTSEGKKLSLQRRTVASKGHFDQDAALDIDTTQSQRHPTLQQRLRTGSNEKYKIDNALEGRMKNEVSLTQKSNETLFTPKYNSKDTPLVKNGLQSLRDHTDIRRSLEQKNDFLFNHNGSGGTRNYSSVKQRAVGTNSQNEVLRSVPLTAAKPEIRTLKLAEKVNFSKFNETGSEQNRSIKNGILERQKTPRKVIAEGIKFTGKYGSLQDAKSPGLSTVRNKTTYLQIIPQKKSSVSNPLTNKNRRERENSMDTLLKDNTPIQNTCTKDDLFKVENSKVTVAVRVRPFSTRDKNEETLQVVSMSGQETVVHHPDTKQVYNFIFDFSLWSVDKQHCNFASQEMVYQSVASPLLETAFEGYNTCLFAYGQTGSGKSYTMMGFDDDERGIIPRFCEDLYTRIANMESQQTYHLEMSYFEVYNEKIHDLLVFRTENGHRKQPLRVREHPIFGPFVEDLTVNVVSSYSDVQRWLQLGNKQRATAATGMNDKSSRSHSVFTLVMTQTKTNIVGKEECEHRIISRMNLIDLAGSERCSASQTTGDRLKEGMIINKSLLTLGKVISTLSEQCQSKKKVFIPYRESVLTWLLKESLGGNSKTAMIAAISPAASNVEETLSTLRYAKQACFIINIAKVNEDMNAKLIQELKAEIDKLKLAQKNVQNIDPEKRRLYVQEITSLRMKLHQQEREMGEMQRAWKEKLEQAEKKKFEETVELQKAGITFKMDNSLPNLVNLNEDPQLSEMLLYMIKEGQTTVGKCKPNSGHDIQLSGALIADDHCVIKHMEGAVSITPLGEAKTYVNGQCISGPTFLHHGDRIILGGNHYFRFNHPVEVQKVKNISHKASLPDDRPKDFEFAKNELLSAQRVELELEIEEARLRAKEEMMQGIQIAKEMAQQELTSQQKIYESQIKSLEVQLEKESHRKQLQEMNTQMATDKIQELEKAKRGLELEVHFNKKRLEMETLAAREALEDHAIRHAKILDALEAEKQKIAQEVQTLQQSHGSRNKDPNWSSLKLSMMIKEANTMSSKLDKHTIFYRHDEMKTDSGKGCSVQVQVRNIRLGVSTFWSLEKFEYKLAAMKELYETNNTSKVDEIFYDPMDEWEPDLSNASMSSFSRRRSRSLRKSKRISGCLSEVKLSLHNPHSTGTINKLERPSLDPTESFVPGICKELISSALDVLGQTQEEESIAQSLLATLFTIYAGVTAMIHAYEQAEESQENFFIVDQAAQSGSIRIASAFERLVVLSKRWLSSFRRSEESVGASDGLKESLKHLGGYLQLLLQGGCSDLSSIVAEAQKKIMSTLKEMVKCIGHLVALTGLDLYLPAGNEDDVSDPKEELIPYLYDGLCTGLEHLSDCIQKTTKDMQDDFSKWYPQNEVQKQLKNEAMAFANILENIISDCKKKKIALLRREELVDLEVNKATSKAAKLFELHHCLDQVFQIVTSSLQGSYRNKNPLRYFVEKICILAGNFNALCHSSTSTVVSAGGPFSKIKNSLVNSAELESVAKSLVISFELELGWNTFTLQDDCISDTEETQLEKHKATTEWEHKGIPKREYKLWSLPQTTGEASPSRIHWV